MAHDMDKEDVKLLKKRLANPNREFDSLFWKPKSRFMRRVKARYVHLIVIMGYLFLLALALGTFYLWFVKHDVVVNADGDYKLEPKVTEVVAPGPGVLTSVGVSSGRRVSQGEVLAGFTGISGLEQQIIAPQSGRVYLGRGGLPDTAGMDSAAEAGRNDLLLDGGAGITWDSVAEGEVIFRIVDFSVYNLKDVAVKKDFDSIGTGDSVTFRILGASGAPYDGQFTFHDPQGEPVAGPVTMGLRPELEKQIEEAVKGDTISSRGFGSFEAARLKSLKFKVQGKVDLAEGRPDYVISYPKTKFPVRGIVVDGYRSLTVTKLTSFNPEVRAVMEEHFAEVVSGKVLQRDDMTYQILAENVRLNLEAELEGRIPLDAPYDPETQPDGVADDNRNDARVVVNIRLDAVPEWVQEQAMQLYALEPPQYLKGRVEILSHRSTWGMKVLESLN